MSKSVECETYVKVTGSQCMIVVYTEDIFYARFNTHKGGDAVLVLLIDTIAAVKCIIPRT